MKQQKQQRASAWDEKKDQNAVGCVYKCRYIHFQVVFLSDETNWTKENFLMYTKVFFWHWQKWSERFSFLAEKFQGDCTDRKCVRMSRLMDLMEKVLRDGIAKFSGNFDKKWKKNFTGYTYALEEYSFYLIFSIVSPDTLYLPGIWSDLWFHSIASFTYENNKIVDSSA